jgi:hemolysin-related protein
MVRSTFIVNKLVTKRSDDISMEDLSQALEIANVKAEDEKELLEGILKFGGTTVTEIMKPRVDIEDINIKYDFSKVVEIVVSTGYSRLPVYEDNKDNIKGILYAKDLLPYIGKNDSSFKWQALLREAYFVPETRMIDDLLEDFRKMQIHMAVVVDEFGGTQGIVTLEDVLEEIVGDINDEYDTEEKYYQKLPDNTYIFDGKTLLNDFFKITGIDEKEFENISEDAETLAGLLLSVKGDFPKEKESISYGNCRFLVLEINKHRITAIKVKVVPVEKTE